MSSQSEGMKNAQTLDDLMDLATQKPTTSHCVTTRSVTKKIVNGRFTRECYDDMYRSPVGILAESLPHSVGQAIPRVQKKSVLESLLQDEYLLQALGLKGDGVLLDLAHAEQAVHAVAEGERVHHPLGALLHRHAPPVRHGPGKEDAFSLEPEFLKKVFMLAFHVREGSTTLAADGIYPVILPDRE